MLYYVVVRTDQGEFYLSPSFIEGVVSMAPAFCWLILQVFSDWFPSGLPTLKLLFILSGFIHWKGCKYFLLLRKVILEQATRRLVLWVDS